MAETTRLKLPLLDASQAQKHITHNEALAMLDLLVGVIPALDRTLTVPPGGSSDGDVYILGGTGTGDWTGFGTGDLALMIDGGWRRTLASRGMLASLASESGLLVWYTGSVWATAISEATFVAQTGAFTIGPTHYSNTVHLATASEVAVTLPADAPVGTNFALLQADAGTAAFAAASGASLHHELNHTRSFGRWSFCGAVVEANAGGTAASWVLYGSTQP